MQIRHDCQASVLHLVHQQFSAHAFWLIHNRLVALRRLFVSILSRIDHVRTQFPKGIHVVGQIVLWSLTSDISVCDGQWRRRYSAMVFILLELVFGCLEVVVEGIELLHRLQLFALELLLS